MTQGISTPGVIISLVIITGCLFAAYYFLIYKQNCSKNCSGICLDSCKNSGTWDPTTKSCSCSKEWQGIDCGVATGHTPNPPDPPHPSDSCGFSKDIEFPSGPKCGSGGSKDGDIISKYCGFFNQHWNDWFIPPDDHLKTTFGINSQADYKNICTAPVFTACHPNIQAKGIQTLFQKYSKGHSC